MKNILITENTFCAGRLLMVSGKPVSLDDREALTLIQCGKAKAAPDVAEAAAPVAEEIAAPVVAAPVEPVEKPVKKPLFKAKK